MNAKVAVSAPRCAAVRSWRAPSCRFWCGFGRYDIMLEPKHPGKDNAVILEFKVRSARKGKSLEETAQSAIAQIRERKYSEELKMKGITDSQIKEYGVAFEGKTVLIVD